MEARAIVRNVRMTPRKIKLIKRRKQKEEPITAPFID